MKISMGIPYWGMSNLISFVFQSLYCRSLFYESKLLEHFRNSLGCKDVFLTDLGRQSIYLALKELHLKSSDEVILPSYVCQSVLLPVIKIGCKPVFADCRKDLNLCKKHVASLINERTKVIIVPHLYGKGAEIDFFVDLAAQRNLFLIDDAAQAFGLKIGAKPAGSFGDFGVFSFGPFKSLPATHGGVLTINKAIKGKSERLASLKKEKFKSVAIRGLKSLIRYRYRNVSYGFIENRKRPMASKTAKDTISLSEIEPVRMSDLDAKLILDLVLDVKSVLLKRKHLADELVRLIGENSEFFSINDTSDPNIFVKFILILKDGYYEKRKKFISYLRRNGIEAQAGYRPLHLHEVFKKYNVLNALPMTEKLWPRVVCLPIHQSMDSCDLHYMAETINRFHWNN